MDALIFFSFSISFLVMSIQLFRNKWLMLISGYNTMLKEERDKIEIRPFAIADARAMAATSLLMCVYGINSLGLSISNAYMLIAFIISWTLFIWSLISIFKLMFKNQSK